MPFTLTMPKLSPTMDEGTIATWHKKEGDFVEAGELLIEVATDKATVEYQALDEGWLRKILIQEGDEALVAQAIAIFTEEKEESIEGYEPEGVLPQKAEHAIVALEESNGAATQGAPLPPLQATGGGMQQPAFVPESPLTEYSFSFPDGQEGVSRLHVSPLARKLAAEKGLDLSTVKGSGPGGRIVSRDLGKAQPASAVAFGRRVMPTQAPGSYEEEKMTPMRKVIGQRLQEAKTFIPHFYVTQEVDATPMTEARAQLKEWGVKVTFNDFVVRAAALALREHPVVNSGINTVENTIVHYKTVDIAIAVSVDGGLITPIVRHADYKNLGQLSREVRSLAVKARDGKLQPEEYKGGSFTISNLGMYGIRDFIAVINPPQGAILAVGGIIEKPVVKEGQIVPGKTMGMTLSSDHRVIDGAAAADFLKTMKRYLEHPAGLLL